MSRGARLRPLAFCLVFLFLLDLFVRAWASRVAPYPFDGRFREGNVAPYEVDGALAALKQAKGSFNVVLIGDSVLRGAYLYDWETVRGVLEYDLRQKLPDANIRVWNFALAGSRGIDKYAMLKRVAPLHPDLVVMNLDYKFFNSPTLSYTFFAGDLQDEPDSAALDRALGLDPYEARLQHAVSQVWALYRNRELINYHLFGAPPYELAGNLVEPPALSRHGSAPPSPRAPWYDKGLTADHYSDLYATRPITPDNANYMAWQHIVRYIDQQQVPAFIYWTPQNHRLLSPLIDNPAYEQNRQTVAALFAGHKLTYQDYDRALDQLDQTDGAFIDADHLTPKGSISFADQLAADILPQVEQRLQEVGP